jgi:hypothetical protein
MGYVCLLFYEQKIQKRKKNLAVNTVSYGNYCYHRIAHISFKTENDWAWWDACSPCYSEDKAGGSLEPRSSKPA